MKKSVPKKAKRVTPTLKSVAKASRGTRVKPASKPKKAVKKAKKKSGRDFAPPVWCVDPCPRCSYVCNKRMDHTGQHACLNRHRW